MSPDFTSIIPYIVIMGIIVGLASLIPRVSSFFGGVVEVQASGRYEVIDGLRGFLALGVFFQHAVTNYFYFQTGIWQITDYRLYRHLGGEAVILFFIITSFLYWSKAIKEKGEMKIDSLYRNRFLRLAPMYLFSALAVTVIALAETGFNIPSVSGFIRDIISWLSLGIRTTTSVNDYSILPINAGIHWTLHFEWIFYLVLPAAAIILTKSPWRFLGAIVFIFALIMPDRGYWGIFLFGILAAHIINKYPSSSWFSRRWMAIIPVAALIAVYFIQYKPYSWTQYIVSFFVFLFFVYGNDLWGLLRTRAARVLGTISYSIYLIHGIILHLVLSSVNYFYKISSLNTLSFWCLILFAGILTVFVSALTYRYVEHPFLSRIRSKPTAVLPAAIVDRVM